MKLIHAVVFASVVNTVVLLQAETSASTSEKSAIAALIGFLAVAFFPLYPLIHFKPDERMLRIRPGGVSTTIGHKSGDIPWTAVERIVAEKDFVYIIGVSGNAFGVPSRAFEGDAQRKEFVELATAWLRESRDVN
jgi:hypothetical protein